jgi:hypothetical protein
VARSWQIVVGRFGREANSILSKAETAPSRIITLDDSYAKLAKLSLAQDELLRQALRCVEHQLYRAAHVMAWSALMDFLEEKLASDGLRAVATARPKWPTQNIEALREQVNEFQLIEVTHVVGLCSKNEVKALHGLLNRRNECAHPSPYFPNLNEALGYVTEVMQRIKHLQPKSV